MRFCGQLGVHTTKRCVVANAFVRPKFFFAKVLSKRAQTFVCYLSFERNTLLIIKLYPDSNEVFNLIVFSAPFSVEDETYELRCCTLF